MSKGLLRPSGRSAADPGSPGDLAESLVVRRSRAGRFRRFSGFPRSAARYETGSDFAKLHKPPE